MSQFRGKTILVTGASRGLGRAIAEHFGRAGAFVAVGFRRREDEARATLEAILAGGGSGELCPFDVTRADDVQRSVTELDRRRPIDVVVNDAGVVDDGPFALLDPARWDRVVRTDLDGTYHVCRAAVGGMLRRRSGSIVNVASTSAVRVLPNQANYAAAKAGVIALTRSLAVELAPHGVRVNAVLPGLIDSGMGARTPHDLRAKVLELLPAKRLGTGAEVADVVAFLASDAASYVTGQALAVDGGLSL